MSQESWTSSLQIQSVLWNEPTQMILEKIMCFAILVSTECLLMFSNSRFCCYHGCSCLVFLVLFLMMSSHVCSPGQRWLPCVAQYDTNWSSCLLVPCTGIASALPHPATVNSLIFYPLATPISHFHDIISPLKHYTFWMSTSNKYWDYWSAVTSHFKIFISVPLKILTP